MTSLAKAYSDDIISEAMISQEAMTSSEGVPLTDVETVSENT